MSRFLLVLLATPATAAMLSITGSATYSASGPCLDVGPTATCYTNSYLGSATVNGGDYINNSTSYVDSGIPYPGGTLAVTTFTNATFGSNPYIGGLAIRVDPSGLTGLPALTGSEAYVWAQGLYDNYPLGWQ